MVFSSNITGNPFGQTSNPFGQVYPPSLQLQMSIQARIEEAEQLMQEILAWMDKAATSKHDSFQWMDSFLDGPDGQAMGIYSGTGTQVNRYTPPLGPQGNFGGPGFFNNYPGGNPPFQDPNPTPTPNPAPSPDPAPSTASGPAPTPTPAPGPTPAPSGPATAVDGGGPKELILTNSDSKAIKVGLFENTGPGMNPDINNPNNTFDLAPGQSIKLSMPDSWQGRAQKISGNADDPATWAEINFENKNGQNNIWYDISLIRGYNSAVTMKATNGGSSASTGQSILAGAPSDVLTQDAGGNTVIDATEPYTGGTKTNIVNYLNGAVGTSNAYVQNFDNGAVRTTTDNSLTVDFGAA
jgi:hypothetical protein